MQNKENKLKWPTMRKKTKLPKESKLSKENKEMIKKIDKWKGKFG